MGRKTGRSGHRPAAYEVESHCCRLSTRRDMNVVFIGIVAAAVAGIGAVYAREQTHATTTRVRIRDIARVFERLVAANTDGAFAMLSFAARGPANAKTDGLNVQFSIENGRPGLDWVLNDPSNI